MTGSDPIIRLNAALEGRYHIESELGEGGMATVYLADDLKHERKVALKVLKPELAAALGPERFLAEIRTTANLQHPHILGLHDSGEADGFLFYVMPYVEGESLRERLKREGQLPVEEAVAIAVNVASALQAAHERGVVHRDVKPANILLSRGESLLADFGIALSPGSTEGERLTGTGMSVGTPAYMSPEQGLEGKEADARSDIYSLGCVLYEMLVGDPPFTGSNPMAVLVRKSTEEPPQIRSVRATVAEELEVAVLRALHRTPADRFPSAADMAGALSAAPSGAITTTASTRRSQRRVPGLAWLAGAAAVALIGVAARGVLTSPAGPDSEALTLSAVPQIERLAVLPLENASGSDTLDYWSTGMQAEIWAELVQIEALVLAPTQSAVRFAGSSESPSEIAAALDVDAILGGTVLVTANSVRLSLQLTAGATEELLWSDSRTESRRDILVLTSQIARDVAAAIRVAVSDEEFDRLDDARVVNPDAHLATLKGKEAVLGNRDEEKLRLAIGHFRQAIEFDSTYAPAWAGLADAYTQLAWTSRLPPDSTFVIAALAADSAVALDPNLGEARAQKAWSLAVVDWDWDGAIAEFEAALRLTPSDVWTSLSYSFMLGWLGRFEDALAESARLEREWPADVLAINQTATNHWMAGDFQAGVEKGLEVLQINPDMYFAHYRLSHSYAELDEFENAINHAERAFEISPDPDRESELAYTYAVSGRTEDARRILGKLIAESSTETYSSPLAIALIYTGLGETEEALNWIEEGYRVRDGRLAMLGVWRHFDSLREEPRFQKVLLDLGLHERVRGLDPLGRR